RHFWFPRDPQFMRTRALLRQWLPQFLQRGRITLDSTLPACGEFRSPPESEQAPHFSIHSILKEDEDVEICFSRCYFAGLDCLWRSGIGANSRHQLRNSVFWRGHWNFPIQLLRVA